MARSGVVVVFMLTALWAMGTQNAFLAVPKTGNAARPASRALQASTPSTPVQDWQSNSLAVSLLAGLIASSLQAPADAFQKDANGNWFTTPDDPDGQQMIKRLNELKVKKDAATARAAELSKLAEQKAKGKELYAKLDEERNKDLAKLEDTIKKNQATREYVLKDLEKRLSASKEGEAKIGEQIAAAKKSFEDFYKMQIEKENKVKQRYDKERANRNLMLADIDKTMKEAEAASLEAKREIALVQDEEDEMTERVFP